MRTWRVLLLIVALWPWTAVAAPSRRAARRASPIHPLVNLRFAYWQYGFPGELKILTDAAREFAQQHEGVTVRIQPCQWDDADVLIRKWTREAGGGQYPPEVAAKYVPDMTIIRERWLEIHPEGLTALDGHITEAEQAQFLEAPLERARRDGKLLGLPWMIRGRALFYRQDLFQKANLEAPGSLGGLQATARRLADAPSVYGFGLPARLDDDGPETFLTYLWAHGGRLCDDKGRLNLTSPEATRALEYMVALVAEKGLTQPEALTWSQDDVERAFQLGRLAMVIGRSPLILTLDTRAPDLRYGVERLPSRSKAFAQIDVDYLAVMATTSQPELCARFLLLLLSDKYARRLSMVGGLPARKNLLRELLSSRDEKLKPFLDRLEKAHTVPCRNWEKLREAVNHALYLALSGREAPRDALRIAQEAAQAGRAPASEAETARPPPSEVPR